MTVDAEKTKAMQVGTNSISSRFTSTITFADDDNAAFFQSRLYNANVKLYQGFLVYLGRYGSGGATLADSLIYGSPEYSYTNTLDGNTGPTNNESLAENAAYVYLEPVEIAIPARGTETGYKWSSEHSASLNMTFPNTEATLTREFEPRYTQGSVAGNGFYAYANLAYQAEDVKYSNIKKDGKSPQRYYVSQEEKIDLLFEADDQAVDDEYDKYGEQSHNRSSLGINAKYIDTGTKYAANYGEKEYIEAVASLDASRIPDTYKQGGYNLIMTFTLQQKQNDGTSGYTYVDVPINTYLDNFKLLSLDSDDDNELDEVVSGAYVTKSIDASGKYTYTFNLDATHSNWAINFDETEEIFDARATFDVKSAGDFEDIVDYLYTNYRLKLTTQIVPINTSASSYEASDWIVYTHAKVNATFVSDLDRTYTGSKATLAAVNIPIDATNISLDGTTYTTETIATAIMAIDDELGTHILKFTSSTIT